MLKRAVIKISGEALSGNSGMFDEQIIGNIARQLKMMPETELALVTGGGNIWRGKDAAGAKPFLHRARADQIGMLGTVINGLYLSERFKLSGIESVVMTPFHVGAITELFSVEAALKAMRHGKLVISAGGTGRPYFSTDTAAALLAAELEADCVLYAKNVDGVYTDDPKKNPGAKKFRRVTYSRVIEGRLEAADTAAMAISLDAGTDSFLFGLNEGDSIINAYMAASGRDEGCHSGTMISETCEEDYYV